MALPPLESWGKSKTKETFSPFARGCRKGTFCFYDYAQAPFKKFQLILCLFSALFCDQVFVASEPSDLRQLLVHLPAVGLFLEKVDSGSRFHFFEISMS